MEWSSIFAGLAFALSLFTLWYTSLREGDLKFTCSRWALIGLSASGHNGFAFSLKIDVYNTGTKPLVIKDLIIEARTHDGNIIFYDPIFLFNQRKYFSAKEEKVGKANHGAAPIPVSIPAEKHYSFPHELLFLPEDKATSVKIPNQLPTFVRLFAKIEDKNYSQVAFQKVEKTDQTKNITNGDFVGILSSESISNRDKFKQVREMSP